jgi:hypothetical protein
MGARSELSINARVSSAAASALNPSRLHRFALEIPLNSSTGHPQIVA